METPRSQDPAAIETFEVSLDVYPGDDLALIRNRDTFAYVATLGAGLEVADVNGFLNNTGNPTPNLSNLLGIYSGAGDPDLAICDAPIADFSGGLKDLAVLVDGESSPPLTTVVGLLAFKGIVILDSHPNAPGQITFLSSACTEELGNANVWGLEVVQDYPLDVNGDGTYDKFETLDLALTAHPTAGVVIYDISERRNPTLLGLIPLPSPAVALHVDRENRLLYASAFSEGVYVIDFNLSPSTSLVDENEDGIDDRILDQIILGGSTNRPLEAYPELGIGVVSGAGSGTSTVVLGKPRLVALGPGQNGGRRILSRLAPLGVPTGPENPEDPSSPLRQSSFHLLAQLPGFVGDEVTMDVVSVGPGGVEIDAPGNPEALPGLPKTSLAGIDAVALERLAYNPWEEGYQIFQSREVVALADLRAAKYYRRTTLEDGVCHSCPSTEFLLGDSLELLSGHGITVRFSDATRAQLRPIYGDTRLDEAQLKLESVPWDLSPSVRQEPTLNPSYGSGDVASGTLIHSGEMTMASTDVSIRGRGFDFALTRTYRSGIVGGGPLGPGYDHSYRRRLRPLPNGDVEYFDGRGRREYFERKNGRLEATGRFVELNRTSTGWVMVDAERNVFRFDPAGRLVSMSDAVKESETTGNEMSFQYDQRSRLVAVVDTLDRTIEFQYDTDGRLTTVRDFSGREFEYDYDSHGRLATFRTPAVTTIESPSVQQALETTFTYPMLVGDLSQQLNRSNNVASVSDAKGQTWLEITFGDADSDGTMEELTSQRWGPGTVNLSYDFDARATTVTDRRGQASKYSFNETGQTVRFEDPTQAVWTYEYNEEGLTTSESLPQGRRTEYAYAATADERRSRANLEELRVLADSRGANGSSDVLVTQIEYDPLTNLATRIVDARGAATALERASSGLPTSVTHAQGTAEETVTSYEYNDYGQTVKVTNPNGNVTELTYFDSGSSAGYLKEIVRDPGALGLTTSFETDGRGNVTAVVDPRDVRHERDFNVLDWQTETRQAASGSSDGASALGHVHRSIYDANGNLAQAEIPFGAGTESTLVRHVYGELDELLETKRQIQPGDAEAAWVTTQLEYDANLNPTKVTDPEGNVREVDYDARNLPEEVRSGLGSDPLPAPIVEQVSYDSNRQVEAFINGLGRTWHRSRDGFGRVQEMSDPLGKRSTRSYDNSHNTVNQIHFDAQGTELASGSAEYDLLNRQTKSKRNLWEYGTSSGPRELVTLFQYDNASNLKQVVDPLDRTTSFEYDAAERQTSQTDPAGNQLQRVLDAAGNVTEIQSLELDPQGETTTVTSTASYDALGRRVSSTDALDNTYQTFFDARGQMTKVVDPENYATEYLYDGLNRVTRQIRPEGISVDYTWDRSSRLTGYRDALNNQTAWTYDAVHRRTSAIYPDANTETFTYDAAHNLTQSVDQRGTTVIQNFDLANRQTGRTVTPAAGDVLEGPLAEGYTYDGLDRLTRAQSGTVVTELTYDSLSRVLSDKTNGRQVDYQFDDAGNPLTITYPSAYQVTASFDPLDRPLSISQEGVEGTLAAFGYRGPKLVQEKTLAYGQITGTMAFDAANRKVEELYTGGPGASLFQESLAWSPRNLKVAQSRGDLNGLGLEFGYDGAGRLTNAAWQSDPLSEIPNNSVPDPLALAGLSRSFDFTYDAAQNLLSRTETRDGIPTVADLPVDASGRNRPSSVGGVPLSWDANGNLTSKGDQQFHYDYRNRLTRVMDSAGNQIAVYTYDAFNRRVAKQVGTQHTQTAWDGWQAIEDYVNEQLTNRRTYGLGLDEIVRQEVDLDGDGVPEESYIPIFDNTGNLVVMADMSGSPVERYEYSPFGHQTILVDSIPPVIEQVRVKDGAIWVEASEEVLESQWTKAIDAGNLRLERTDTSELLQISAQQPIQEGPLARRRLVLSLVTPPDIGTEVRLTFEPPSLMDVFRNQLSVTAEYTFDWLASDLIVDDTTPPKVEQIAVRSGVVEVTLSEEANPALAATGIVIGGNEDTWLLQTDGYTLIANTALSDGVYELRIGTGPLDLTGLGLDSELVKMVIVDSENPEVAFYRETDPRMIDVSSMNNPFGFHGHPVDSETGLVYMRNRYYDPNLGQFITVDPLGYIDGPSMYQFTGNSPFNYRDSLGLYQADVHFYVVYYLGRLSGFSSDDAYSIAYGSQYVDDHKLSEPLWNSFAGWRKGKATALPSWHLYVRVGKVMTTWGDGNWLLRTTYSQMPQSQQLRAVET